MKRGGFIVALACVVSGCMPWALGPSRTSVTVGGSGQVASDGPVEGALAVVTRVEADATQLVTETREREGDFGLGIVHLDYLGSRRQSEARTGGTLSGRYFLVRFDVGEDAVGRLALGAHADAFWRATGFGGAGGAVALELEVAGALGTDDFAGADANDDGFFFIAGGYSGEIGVALRAEVAYHVLVDETPYLGHRWTATLGVMLRVPVLGGVVGGIPLP